MKKIGVISAIYSTIVSISLCALIFHFGSIPFWNNPKSSYADFKAHIEDYEQVVRWIKENYPDEETIHVNYIVAEDRYTLNGKTADEIDSSLRGIRKSFKLSFEVIEVNGSQVSFCSFGNEYAVVYSPNGKPKDVFSNKCKIYSEKICVDWYHVVRK